MHIKIHIFQIVDYQLIYYNLCTYHINIYYFINRHMYLTRLTIPVFPNVMVV